MRDSYSLENDHKIDHKIKKQLYETNCFLSLVPFSLLINKLVSLMFFFGPLIADFGVSAKNTRTLQRRDSFIGTPYWLVIRSVKIQDKTGLRIWLFNRSGNAKSRTFYKTLLRHKFCYIFFFNFLSFPVNRFYFTTLVSVGWLLKWWCVRPQKTDHMTTKQTSGLLGSHWSSWHRSSHPITRWTLWESCSK